MTAARIDPWEIAEEHAVWATMTAGMSPAEILRSIGVNWPDDMIADTQRHVIPALEARVIQMRLRRKERA